MCMHAFISLTLLLFVLPDENESEMAEKAADEEDVKRGNSDNSDVDEDEGTITEIRFVPSDRAACELPQTESGSDSFCNSY